MAVNKRIITLIVDMGALEGQDKACVWVLAILGCGVKDMMFTPTDKGKFCCYFVDFSL